MGAEERRQDEERDRPAVPSPPGGLLDLLSVAAVVLDDRGRCVLWSPQAEEVFGYTAEEALGQYAAQIMVHEEHIELVIKLFSEVMETGASWAGAFPIRRKDGTTRLVEFRNVRLLDDNGAIYALGIAADHTTLQQVETDLALSERLVSQAPIGIALMDTELRYVLVNPALERINGMPAADHIGHRTRDLLPSFDAEAIELVMRRVLHTGTPVIDQYIVGRTPADPDNDHAWSVSFHRLEGSGGRIIGVATSIVDVSERHWATIKAERAQHRLSLIADASARVGTRLEVEKTAQELAEVAVPDLADLAAVDVLDAVLAFRRSNGTQDEGSELFRTLAVATAYPTDVTVGVKPGDQTTYGEDRLITRCVHTRQAVLVPCVEEADLQRIARSPDGAAALARAGLHSYLAVPLIAGSEVLGALELLRARNPLPFDEDDAILAGEIAARAAVSIDNARWHQNVRNAAETLQRSLLPGHPPQLVGLEVVSHYQPAGASAEVGGDWYDVIPLADDKTALVIGDVMGNGIDAAANMGRLRTATGTLADLDMTPDEVLRHLDKTTRGLEQYATCIYAVYDPHRRECRIANAGHMPPVLIRDGHHPELLDLPTGAPLGVGGVPFDTTTFALDPGDRLVLYTDGLVETRHDPIDERLDTLVHTLDGPRRPMGETCDWLLQALRHPDDHDDVALLIAQAGPVPGRPTHDAEAPST
ncbi:SpoIIE family protein phosphatase [Streptomyces sp. NPDC004362]|uniref:SpoIIE family protein phosphatase n=1 Tax=Streptomyces sp. NPDC004362 TaxID=3154456 RepID=UPI0033AA4A8E